MEDFDSDEYVAQCYGPPMLTIERGISELVDGVITWIMEDFEKKLSVKGDREKVRNSINGLRAAYKDSHMKFKKEFKRVINEYFSLSPNILLPSDSDQDVQYTEEEEKEVDRQLEAAKEALLQREAMEVELKKILPANNDHLKVEQVLSRAYQTLTTASHVQDDMIASHRHLSTLSKTIRPLLQIWENKLKTNPTTDIDNDTCEELCV